MKRSLTSRAVAGVAMPIALSLALVGCSRAPHPDPFEPLPPGVSFTAPRATTPPSTAPRRTGTTIEPAAAGRDGKVQKGRRVSGSGYTGVALDPDAWTRDQNAQEWFQPTDDDIAGVESGLAGSLGQIPQRGGPSVIAKLDSYQRQYVGKVLNGRRVLAINAVCESEMDIFERHWDESVAVVADGGECFWQAEIDIETGVAQRFGVNGFA